VACVNFCFCSILIASMKIKQLESLLQNISVFDKPKIDLEQYPTSPHIAARLLHTAHTEYDDIESAIVTDLGIGCGVLTAGAVFLDSAFNIGLDVDLDALNKAAACFAESDLEVDLIHADAKCALDTGLMRRLKCDTVIMNPPFGTRVEGIDAVFLELAANVPDIVFELTIRYLSMLFIRCTRHLRGRSS
jgi:rRNA N6-adenosine-methyltransferase METTL5